MIKIPIENYTNHVYHIELKIKYTSESNTSVPLLVSLSRWSEGTTDFTLSLYEKLYDDFNFHINKLSFPE